MPVNKRYSNSDLLDFFRTRISTMSPESRMRYRKTVSELDVFLTGHHLQLADLSPELVTDWTVEMLYRGLANSTVAKHLNFFSGLLKSASQKGMIATCETPRQLSKILTQSNVSFPALMHDYVFNVCLTILRNAVKRTEGHNVFEDIFLMSILNGALPLEEIVAIKTADVQRYSPASRFIIERNRSNKRDYVFDLRQSYLTPKQIKATINHGISGVFDRHVKTDGFDADDFVRSMWVACAIHSGLSSSEALGYADGTVSYAVPEFCHKAAILLDNKGWWINTVNATLLHDMPQWYAMHLRKGVTFEDVRKDILDKVRPIPELFYPCETIVRLTGNRKNVEEQPFIAKTVFFKAHPENVLPMFKSIGEKAWCYRALSVPGSPYAVIPRRDMERFQRAIGVFTPDVEITPLGALAPKPGESVIVVKAGFGNRTGEVEEVINKGCGSAIFRVKLTTDNGYEFRINVDERQIECIIA